MFSASGVVSGFSKYLDKHRHRNDHDQTGETSNTPPLWNAEAQGQDLSSRHHNDQSQHLLESRLKISHVQELGTVSSVSTRVERDLGFQGKLGPYILLSYGDTMYRDKDWSDNFIGMTCNSVGLATIEPTKVVDPLLNETGHPQFFLKPASEYNEDYGEDALGITNVVEITPDKGVLYYLLNHRPNGQQQLVGSGIAEVFLTNDSATGQVVPQTHRLCQYWWPADTEPSYGDICALRHDQHVYAYGHMKDNPWVYLTRAPVSQVLDINAYEYWNGDTWQRERLHGSNLGEKESVFWKIQQGQIIWSNYHGCFLFVYCDAWWTNQILIKTASEPQGPWSEPITVHKAKLAKEGGCIYSAVPHPYFDPTGKTLVISYTNMPNIIQSIKVFFE